jgi:hypothetical protein
MTRSRTGRGVSWWVPISLATLTVVIVITLAVSFLHNTTIGRRARHAKATADVESIASAVMQYRLHTGALPDGLVDLTSPAADAQGTRRGPFLPSIPAPPPGWTAYRYELRPGGAFIIMSTGDGQMAASAKR